MSVRYHMVGGYTPSEAHMVITASNYRTSMAGKAIVYLHGAGQNNADSPDARVDLELYAEQGHVVHAGLVGGLTTWGNATSVSAVDAILTYMNASYGAEVTSPILIADSHGASIALNWAVRNASRLKKAILRVPGLSLQTIHDTNVAALAAGMETAYGGLSPLVAAYSTRDPNHATFRALIISSGLVNKLRIYYNAADPIVNAVDVLAFAAATGVQKFEMGGPSHAPWGYFNISDQYMWLMS